MLGRRRNNRNINTPLMMTIVGLGVGAAAYGLMRDRNNNNISEPLQKALDQAMDQMNE